MILRSLKSHCRLLVVVLLHLFILLVYVKYVECHICEVGREKDETGTWMWVLPYDKPCLCTEIVMGGMNTWTPIRPFKPVYVNNPLLSDNVGKIRRHYRLICDQEDDPEFVTMSDSLEAALSSTELGIPSENSLSQTAAKLSEFVSSFYTTATNSVTNQERRVTESLNSASTANIGTTTSATSKTEQRSTFRGNQTSDIATTMLITTKTERQPTHVLTSAGTSEIATTAIREECSAPLGMESGAIPDSSISASSYLDASPGDWDRLPQYARIGSDRFWASNWPTVEWIQVNLGSIHMVTGLQTQGNYQDNEWQYWVTQIKVEVGMSEALLHAINDEFEQVFDANTGPHDVAMITLNLEGIATQFVRIYPIGCVKGELPGHCVLRFELLGCLQCLQLDMSNSVPAKIPITVEVCSKDEPLGMESGEITDFQITASSFYEGQGELKAWKGRLNNNNYWATSDHPPTEKDPWIQVDLLHWCKVTGVITQGSAHVGKKEWVTYLQIQYGDSDNSLIYMLKNAETKSAIFPANTNRDSPVTITFAEPIKTRILRIRPTHWNKWCAFRFEVIGCMIKCSAPLGMASGRIPDMSITASSYLSDSGWDRLPKYARLWSKHIWANAGKDQLPWIQVDLCTIHRVTGLQTKGDYHDEKWQYWVQQIKIQVGMIAEDLKYINGSDGQARVYDANNGPDNVAEISIDITGILTRFVRIYPINCVRAGNQDLCVLKFEILGCLNI